MNASLPLIVVTGEYFCDLVFGTVTDTPLAGREVFGDRLEIIAGGTFNIAAGLARAGIPTAWAVDFGTDPFSKLVRRAALDAGVQGGAFRQIDRDMPRLSAAFSFDGDRGFLSSSLEPVRPVPLEGLEPTWMVQTFRWEADWRKEAQLARSKGIKLFGDCRSCDATLEDPEVVALLECLDVFAPNEEEAKQICQTTDCDAALEQLAQIVPVVVITRGSSGAIYRDRDHVGHATGYHVPFVDSIGAGDAFNCGFLAGAVLELPTADCVSTGCLFGAYAVTQVGGGKPPNNHQLIEFAKGAGADIPAPLQSLLAGKTSLSELLEELQTGK